MRAAIVIPFLAALLALAAAAQQPCPKDEPCLPDKSCPRDDREPNICARFSGPLTFRTAKGLVPGRVVMQQWQIANDTTAEISHQGLLVVHLRAGALVAEIKGEQSEQKEWRVGSIWSVPAGKRLVVHTRRDSVALQTVDFITR